MNRINKKTSFSDLIERFWQQKIDLLTHSAKYRVGKFDVGPTRYPRGKWGFSNKNPTSGPPTVGFPLVVLTLANTRNDELFKLLDTYPGNRHLYFGHDLATGFSAFAIALGIFSLIYYVFYDKFEDEETNRQPVVQVFLIFAFIVQSVLLRWIWNIFQNKEMWFLNKKE